MQGTRPDHSNWPCPGHPLGEKLLNQEFVSRPKRGRSQQTNDRAARSFFPCAPGQPGGSSDISEARSAARSPQLLTVMKSYPFRKSKSCKTSMREKPAMKIGAYLARLLLVACALICFQFPLAHAADATVITDQEDYPPFSVVWITGTGFQPGETVSNQVVQLAGPAPGAAYEPWEAVADTDGNFETSWYVFSDDLLDTTLE